MQPIPRDISPPEVGFRAREIQIDKFQYAKTPGRYKVRRYTYMQRLYACIVYAFKTITHLFSAQRFSSTYEAKSLKRRITKGKERYRDLLPIVNRELIKIKEGVDIPAWDDIPVNENEDVQDLFAIAHADFTGLDIGKAANMNNTLQGLCNFFTRGLSEHMLHDPGVQKIREQLQDALRMQHYQEELKKLPVDVSKELFGRKIMELLREKGDILLGSGYASVPAGHAILFKLQLHREGNQEFISGEVINRGAGSQYHKQVVKGGRMRVSSHLLLEKRPIEEISNSGFWSILYEMNGPNRAKEGEVQQEPNLSSQDFYEVLLGLWPGDIECSRKKSHIVTKQYGPTCTFKSFPSYFRDILGKKKAYNLNIEFYLYTFRNFVQEHAEESEKIPVIRSAMQLLSRKIEKMKNLHYVTKERAEEIEREFAEIKERIDQAEQRKKEEVEAEKMQPLDCGKVALCTFQNGTRSVDFENEEVEKLNPPILAPESSVQEIEEYYTNVTRFIDANRGFFVHNKVRRVLKEAVLSLPSVDSEFWQQCSKEEMFSIVAKLSQQATELFLSGYYYETPTPHQGVFLLKLMAIETRLASLHSSLRPLAFYFQEKALRMFRECYFCRPSRPELIKEFEQNLAFLQVSSDELEVEKEKGEKFQYIVDPEEMITVLNIGEFQSLEAIKNNSEGRFLVRLWEESPEGKGNHENQLASLQRFLSERLKTTPKAKQYRELKQVWHNFVRCCGMSSTHYYDQSKRVCYTEAVYDEEKKLFTLRDHFDGIGKDGCKDPFCRSSGLYREEWMHPLLLPAEAREKEQFCGQKIRTQNQQMQLEEREHRIPGLELRELSSITTCKELIPAQLVDYFSLHLNRLKQKEFRSLFFAMLFQRADSGDLEDLTEKSVIQNLVKGPKETLEVFFAFLENGQQKAVENEWHDVLCFLMRIEGMLLSSMGEEADHEFFTSRVEKFQNKADFYLQDKKKKKELSSILISLLPYWQGETTSLLSQHIVDSLFRRIHTFPSDIVQDNNQFEEEYAEGFQVLEEQRIAKQELPSWVTSYPLYEELLQKRRKVEELQPGGYKITNIDGQVFEIGQFEGKVYLYYQKGEDWYQYQEVDSQFSLYLEGLPQEHPFRKKCFSINTSYWLLAKEGEGVNRMQGLLWQHPQKEPMYELTEKGLSPIDQELYLAEEQQSDSMQLLNQFSLIANMLFWKNERGELQKIECKEFGVNFEKDEKTNRYYSSLHPGYYIDEKQKVYSLQSLSPHLILRNREGKRILIMPARQFKEEKASFFVEKRELLYGNNPLLVYKLDQQGEIIPPVSTREFLYLIYTLLMHGDYEQASKWAKKTHLYAPQFSEEEFAILRLFIPSKEEFRDKHPVAMSVRLELFSLFMHQAKGEEREQIDKLIFSDYAGYITQINNAFLLRLSIEKERDIIKEVRKRGERIGLSTEMRMCVGERMAELGEGDQWVGAAWSKDPFETRCENMQRLEIEKNDAVQMVAHENEPLPIESFVRPGKAFIHNLLYYLAIVKEKNTASPEYQKLLFLLSAAQYDPDENVSKMIFLLEAVRRRVDDVSKATEWVENIKDLSTSDNKETFHKYVFCMQRELRSSFLQEKERNREYQIEDVRSERSSKRLIKPKEASFPQTTIQIPALHVYVPQLRSEEYFRADRSLKKKEFLQNTLQSLNHLEQLFLQLQEATDDPAVKNEYEKTLVGVRKRTEEIDTQLRMGNFVTIDENKIVPLREDVTQSIARATAALSEREKEILNIAHGYPVELLQQVRGNILTPLSISQLLVVFGKEDDRAILRSNPSLKEEDVRALKKAIGEYLLIKTEKQLLERVVKQLDIVEKTEGVLKEKAVEKLVSIMKEERCYDPIKHPYLLLFEALFDLRIRKEQFDVLQTLRFGEEQQRVLRNMVIEARTGFGKSKVLIPLWAYLMTTQDRLTTVTVPESLFTELYGHLRELLGDGMDLAVVPIHFNREMGNSISKLEDIRKRLAEAKRERRIVLMTPSTMHNLALLKTKEGFFEKEEGCSFSEQQKVLFDIREKLRTEVTNFFEESTECLDIRHPYDYAVGQREAVNKEHANTIFELYNFLLFNADAGKNVLFEFMSQQEGTPITKEYYVSNMLPKLAQECIEKVLHIPQNDPIFRVLVEDIQGRPSERSREYHKSLQEKERVRYATLQQQLINYLPQTLTRNYNERYILDQNRIAVPASRGKIIPRSQFTTIDHLLNFTVQGNLREAFTTDDVTSYFEMIKKKIQQNSDFKKTSDYDAYCSVVKDIEGWPESIFNVEEEEVEKFIAYIEANLQKKLQFIFMQSIPRIEIHMEKIASSAHDLTSMLAHSQGGSGTVTESIPGKLETVRDPTATMNTLVALQQKCQGEIHSFPIQGNEETLQTLLHTNRDKKVLIDIAGTFRDYGNYKRVAESILENTLERDIEGVCYFDKEGSIFVLDRKTRKIAPLSDSDISKDKLFWYFGQSDIVGHDAPLPMDAKAIITLHKGTTREDFLQGVGRLREIASGQTGSLYMREDDLSCVRKSVLLEEEEPILLCNLLEHLYERAGEDSGRRNFESLLLEFRNIVETSFWQFEDLQREKGVEKALEETARLFQMMRTFFATSTQIDPVKLLGKEQRALSGLEAINRMKEAFIAEWENHIAEYPHLHELISSKELEKRCDLLIQKRQHLLPKVVSMHEQAVEVHNVEVVQEEVHEQESVEEEENIDYQAPSHVYFTPAEPPPLGGRYNTIQFEPIKNKLKRGSGILGEDVLFAKSYLTIASDQTNLHHKMLKYSTQKLLIEDKATGEVQLVLLDLHSAAEIYSQIQEDNRKGLTFSKNYYLMGRRGILVQNTDQALNEQQEQVMALQVRARPFSGHLHFTKEELEYLRKNPQFRENYFIWIKNNFFPVWPHYEKGLNQVKEMVMGE